MPDWRMPADESVVIEDAELLGSFSTDDGHSRRWVELELIGSDNGYLVNGCGKSRVEGEIDRPWAKWYPEAFLVVRTLLSPPAGRQENTTGAARKMLASAARLDEGIAEALGKWRG